MGQLERLLIHAYSDAAFSNQIGTFESYVNPAEIVLTYEHEFDSGQGAGTTGSRMEFKKIKPGDLTLSFFLDGTGANGRPLDVQAKIAEFQKTTGYNGDKHQPSFLKVVWGTLAVKRCVLKSATITYKLFRPNGVPLRATINAVFTDAVSDPERVAMAQDSSPDLTHVRTLRAGDSLAALCHEIYGDPALYLKVARANGLTSPRDLPPGTRVRFPPLAK
jgi:hypothetical protein